MLLSKWVSLKDIISKSDSSAVTTSSLGNRLHILLCTIFKELILVFDAGAGFVSIHSDNS